MWSWQTRQEFQVLQGSTIDAQFVKRGKTISSRKLRNSAKKFDGWFVDYRKMGYVTEVKDQVRHPSICPKWLQIKIKIESRAAVLMLFTGVLWLMLGLQYYRRYWGTTLQKDRSAYIFEWTKPRGLLQIVRHLRLQWCMDGQCLWLRGQQRVTVDRNLPIHLRGEALPAGRHQTLNYCNRPLTSGSVPFF